MKYIKNKTKKSKKNIRKTQKRSKKTVGGEPVIKNNDMLIVPLVNLDERTAQHKKNPVYVFNRRDFNIDEDGNLYLRHQTGTSPPYGHIDENDILTMEYGYTIRTDGFTLTIQHATHRIVTFSPIMVRPHNISLVTNAFLLRQVGPELPDNIITKRQLAEKYTGEMEDEFRDAYLNKALYVIYEKNTNHMYVGYEFIRAEIGSGKKKNEGSLIFKKSDIVSVVGKQRAVKSQLLSDIPGAVAALPIENEESEMGKDYRAMAAEWERKKEE